MASSPPCCLTTASSWSLYHCITTGSLSSLLHCFSTASSSLLLLRITWASSSCVHYCITTALSTSWFTCISSASLLFTAFLHQCSLIHKTASLLHRGPVHTNVSLHFHGVVLRAASGYVSIAAPPWHWPHVSFASGCHVPPDAPVRGVGAPCASSGLPGAAAHSSSDDPVLEVLAAPSCSTPDNPVRGVSPPLVPG